MLYYTIDGDGEGSDAYSIKSNNELLIEGEACTITELTDQKFVFHFGEIEDGEGELIIFTLSR